MNAFKQSLAALMMGERPTGRPAMMALIKNMRMKLKETVANMKALKYVNFS